MSVLHKPPLVSPLREPLRGLSQFPGVVDLRYTEIMVTILLHSSKTMQRSKNIQNTDIQKPVYSNEASTLATYLQTLSPAELKRVMGLSDAMVEKTQQLVKGWRVDNESLPAIDAFLGDIYSGLQVQSFTKEDRLYANKHLFILSGLYGILRALDEVQPYRLEMGYKLSMAAKDTKGLGSQNLYEFWGDKIAKALPKHQAIINLSAVEYTKAVFPYLNHIDGLKDVTVVTPKFLTVSPKTGEPTFVTVHAKVARGAFARWLIQHRVETLDRLQEFNEVGYAYAPELSTPTEPVFLAQSFKGIGLSVRLIGKTK